MSLKGNEEGGICTNLMVKKIMLKNCSVMKISQIIGKITVNLITVAVFTTVFSFGIASSDVRC